MTLQIGDTPEQLNTRLGHTVEVIIVGNKAYTAEDIRQLELEASTAAFNARSQLDMKIKAREQRDKATERYKEAELQRDEALHKLYRAEKALNAALKVDHPFKLTICKLRTELKEAYKYSSSLLVENEKLRHACQLAIDMFKANNINVPNTIETLEDALE